MKKLFFFAIFVAFTYFGAAAQNQPGNSAFGHSHKKAKRHYEVTHHNYALRSHHDYGNRSHHTYTNRRTYNETHRTSIQQANALHHNDMRRGKNK